MFDTPRKPAKYVMRVRKNGREYFYFRKKGYRSFNLSPGVDPYDDEAARADFEARAEQYAYPHIEEQRARIRRVLAQAFSRSRRRASVIGCTFSIEHGDVERLLEDQGYKCAVSGLPFSAAQARGSSRANPFRPSIDRISPSKGYEPKNVRIVLVAVNIGLADFGDRAYRKICRAVAGTQ